jgi:hypothetical protein
MASQHNYLQLFQRIDVSTILIPGLDDLFLSSLRSACSSDPFFLACQLGKLPTSFALRDGLLYYKDRLWLPTPKLRHDILSRCHDSPTAGHFGVLKTLDLVRRHFYWPHMSSDVRHFIRECDMCCRIKSSTSAPQGLLHPLPIPSSYWTDISMDFITDLPTSSSFDCVFVVKDRLSKQAHYIPCLKTISGEETA